MRKTVLILLSLLSLASMLSGCFYYPYPYRNDYYDRGYQHDRGDHGERDYNDRRDGGRYYR